MTIVLGHPADRLTDHLDEAVPGGHPAGPTRSFEDAWAARKERVAATMARREHPTWRMISPDLVPEPRFQPNIPPVRFPVPELVQDIEETDVLTGVVDLYAKRQARQPGSARKTLCISPKERAVVGGRMDPTQTRRGVAVVREKQALGRGTASHYTTLHPSRNVSLDRLKRPEITLPKRHVRTRSRRQPIITELPSLNSILNALATFVRPTHPRRVVVTTIAVMVLTLSAVSSTLAEQYQYTVQEGDTINSIAATFGVEPDAIRASSDLPNGDELRIGQVLVIPDAEGEAASDGDDPYVLTVHVVVEGETISSIGQTYGVPAQELIDFNGVEDPTNVLIGTRLLIPATETATIPEEVSAPIESEESSDPNAPTVEVSGVIAYQQQHTLSCEYASAFIATSAFGAGVDEGYFIASVPLAQNPHYGYRGNIDGVWGGTTDYGVYAEAMVPTLNDWGFNADVFYGDGSTVQLTGELDAGRPVLVWVGLFGDTGEVLSDDGTYTVASGQHVVVAYGYNDAGIFISDPANASYKFLTWDAFLAQWNVLDGMALSVYPMGE